MMARLPAKRGKKNQFQLAPQTEHGGSAWARWRVQRLLEVLAVVVIVAMLTREPARSPILATDIDASPVASEEVRAAFYFETEDLEATRLARDKVISDIPDTYRVDSRSVREPLLVVRERVKMLFEQRGVVQQAVHDALLASTEAEKPEAVARKAVAELAAKLKLRPGWEAMPDASILSEWLMPDLASLPTREFAAAPEAPAAGKPTGRGAKAAATEAVTAPAPRKVARLVPEDAGTLTFNNSDVLTSIALGSLEYVLSAGIRGDTVAKGAAPKPIILVRDVSVEDLPPSSGRMALADVPALSQAGERLSARLREAAKRAVGQVAEAESWTRLHEAARAMVEPALRETIHYDMVATASATEQAKDAVAPVMKSIEAGEIIQDRNKKWTEQSRSDVRTYLQLLANEEQPLQRIAMTAAANLIFALLAFFTLRRTVSMFAELEDASNTREYERFFNLGMLLICGTLVVGRVASYFEPSGFLMPVAAGSILCAILVNARVAVLVCSITAVLLSAQYGYDWRLLCTAGAMGLAGVFSIHKVRKRSDMAAASLKATFVGLVSVVAITLAMDAVNSTTALQRGVLILMNGGLCLLLVPAMLSPLERLFGITTDITLLEYSDLNNELLKRLAIEAPGTYAHSQVLGQLAEAAADVIGANGLMARVAAYYHDIGKMRRKEYFCENQQGTNIHDDLSPRLSARAIAAHVTYGVEMAREHHLPKPIIDGILEHHGTCMIGYFHQQALKQQKHGDVQEDDFRYPGPKPQRPETAILMICDAVESGVRSIKHPNEERVREFVDKIIAARNADRQFDDCNLTLKQLDLIAEEVTKRAVSNLHGRISYSEEEKDNDTGNIVPMHGAGQ